MPFLPVSSRKMGGSTHTTSRLLCAVAWLDEDNKTVNGHSYVLVHAVIHLILLVVSCAYFAIHLTLLEASCACLLAILSVHFFFIYTVIVMRIGEMCAGSLQW